MGKAIQVTTRACSTPPWPNRHTHGGDIESPELSRMVCDRQAGFVPPCTDDRQGFWQLIRRHARAIENQFAAVTGTVGTWPSKDWPPLAVRHHHPSDFPSARDGIVAKFNMEQQITDVDLAKLVSNRHWHHHSPLHAR
jgi:hypothetical protein